MEQGGSWRRGELLCLCGIALASQREREWEAKKMLDFCPVSFLSLGKVPKEVFFCVKKVERGKICLVKYNRVVVM